MCTFEARVGPRGVITIPAGLRRELRIKPGDQIDFVDDGKGGLILKPIHNTARKPARRARKRKK